jgi:hypothetical protein
MTTRNARLLLAAVLGLILFTQVTSADSPSFGPVYDDFDLTLQPGWRTEILGPLYYDQHRGTETTWAFPPLLSDTKDPGVELHEFDFLYPVMTYDRYGDQYRWQFFQLLSFSGGPNQKTTKRRFTLFPLYFQQRSTDPSEDYTALVPFYGHLRRHFFRDEVFFVMFPFYLQTQKHGVVTDNYLFPIFHLRHGPGLQGWQFWPLVGHEHKDVTTRTNGFNDVQTIPGHDSFFALWPIFFNDHTGIGSTNQGWQQAVLPFYSFLRSPLRDSTTVIWPFFSKVDDRGKKYREWDAPWPLIEFARGEGKTTSRVWPFFSDSHNATMEDDFIAWPFFKYERAHPGPLDRQRARLLFFLASNTIEKNTQTKEFKKSSYLWPLFTYRRDFKGRTRLQFFAPLEPFTQGSHKIERDWSPVWSVWRAENNPVSRSSSQSFLWNLYRRDVTPERKKVSLLLGLFQYQSGPEDRRLRLFYIPVLKGKSEAGEFRSLEGLEPGRSNAAAQAQAQARMDHQ